MPASKPSTPDTNSSTCWSTWRPRSANSWRASRLLRRGREGDRRHRVQLPEGRGLHALLAARRISYVRVIVEQYPAHGHIYGMLHHRSANGRGLPGQHFGLDQVPYRRELRLQVRARGELRIGIRHLHDQALIPGGSRPADLDVVIAIGLPRHQVQPAGGGDQFPFWKLVAGLGGDTRRLIARVIVRDPRRVWKG